MIVLSLLNIQHKFRGITMAIQLQKKAPINAIEVVSQHDDAVDAEGSNWEEYKSTGDISKLKFIPGKQPTIFLCNFAMKGHEAASLKNSMLGGTDDEGKPQVAFGTWSFRAVKYCLKDIKNPDGMAEDTKLVFKKDEKGYAHDDLLATLESLGIINEIFGMYTSLALGGVKGNAKN